MKGQNMPDPSVLSGRIGCTSLLHEQATSVPRCPAAPAAVTAAVTVAEPHRCYQIPPALRCSRGPARLTSAVSCFSAVSEDQRLCVLSFYRF